MLADDNAQLGAFFSGLIPKVTLIQGSPGIRFLNSPQFSSGFNPSIYEIVCRGSARQDILRNEGRRRTGLLLHGSRHWPVSCRLVEAGNLGRVHRTSSVKSLPAAQNMVLSTWTFGY